MRVIQMLVLAVFFTACTEQGNKGEDSEQVVDTTQQEVVEQIQEDTTVSYQFPKLEGKEWSLTSYVIDNETKKLVDDSQIVMTLAGDKVSGSAGCNNYNGTVIIQSDGAIDFSQIASTKRLCQGLMTQEKEYLQLLENAQSYSVNRVFLEIECRSGKLSYRTAFIPKEE